MSSEGVNSLEKNADAHRVGCSFSEHHTGLEVRYKVPKAGRVCVVALETACHSVMGCICSFVVTMASLLAAIKWTQKTLALK